MKEIRDFVNEVGKTKLDPLAKEVAKKIFNEVIKIDEDYVTVTLNLLRQEFLASLELQLEILYLDETEHIAYKNFPLE